MLGHFRLPLVLVAVPLLLYGGLKGFVHYQAKGDLADLKSRLAPYATLHYGGIDSTLWNGRLAVEQVTLQPTGFSDVIRIDHVVVEAGSLPGLLASHWGRGGPPERLRLAVRGLDLDLGGPMMNTFDRLLAQAASHGAGLTMAHCGDITYAGPRQYRKFGYERLVSDLSVGWTYDRRAQRLAVEFDGNTRDMGEYGGTVEMLGVASPGQAAAMPRLAGLRFNYRDQSYVQRAQRYCTEASGLSAEDYIEAEIDYLSATFYHSWGEGFGPGLRAAYRDFLANPGELRFELRPGEDFDYRMLALLTPGDLLNQVNATLTVNGNPVADLSFDPNARPAAARRPAAAAAGQELPPQHAAAPAARAARAESGYRPVPVAELGRHIGRAVRVHVIGAAVREGVLAEVRPLEIVVERRYGSGNITVKVPTSRIARVEALF